MKKVIKNRLFLVLFTAIICIKVSVYATTQYLASEIEYKDTTVENALNELYTLTSNRECVKGTFNCTGNCSNEIGMRIDDIDFNPTIFFAARNNNSASIWYNADIDANNIYVGLSTGNNSGSVNSAFRFNNGVELINWTGDFIGESYFIACK